MSIIGTGNSYAGTAWTLALNVNVHVVPNDNGSEHAPDFRIITGNGLEIGVA
ncbi:DUF736 family protein [Roseateles sp.]|uniref:DUF736 family protein n=1 Tax=Roseateles sp. TaxID=1971397 RepID=UPI0039EACF24